MTAGALTASGAVGYPHVDAFWALYHARGVILGVDDLTCTTLPNDVPEPILCASTHALGIVMKSG